MHMSKQGAVDVRALLYMVVLSALRHNPIIRALYARCRAKGMDGNAAIGVCMHKTLRIVYGMLTTNRPFDPEIHRAHQNRTQHHPASLLSTNNVQRRQYDQHAPISRRQHKKRKEQTASQDDTLVTNGIMQTTPSLSELNNNMVNNP
jgi:transposase